MLIENKNRLLIAIVSTPVLVFSFLFVLAFFNVIPRTVYNNIRQFMAVLGPHSALR